MESANLQAADSMAENVADTLMVEEDAASALVMLDNSEMPASSASSTIDALDFAKILEPLGIVDMPAAIEAKSTPMTSNRRLQVFEDIPDSLSDSQISLD